MNRSFHGVRWGLLFGTLARVCTAALWLLAPESAARGPVERDALAAVSCFGKEVAAGSFRPLELSSQRPARPRRRAMGDRPYSRGGDRKHRYTTRRRPGVHHHRTGASTAAALSDRAASPLPIAACATSASIVAAPIRGSCSLRLMCARVTSTHAGRRALDLVNEARARGAQLRSRPLLAPAPPVRLSGTLAAWRSVTRTTWPNMTISSMRISPATRRPTGCARSDIARRSWARTSPTA